MMNPKNLTTFVIIFLSLNVIQAQTKFEKEYRLKNSSVPANAQAFIDSLHFQEKVKWYFEENNTGNSIEAKFKTHKTKYSIEFDVDGKLQDVEIEIKWPDVSKSVQDQIITFLDANYGFFKIEKIQVQHSGASDSVLHFLNDKKTQDITTRYELIVKTRLIRKVVLFEIVFDEKGQHLSTAQIQFKNIDNLEY
ncbi:MAG: hypothetical protein JNK77_00245 [Saprospiraceae bacterium]|nr:hypothetical protein [Saprospiraceae bacterium]